MAELRIKKLTEEQINQLPFPERAREIGGVLEVVDGGYLTKEDVERFRKNFDNMMKRKSEKISRFRTLLINIMKLIKNWKFR